MKTYTMPIVFYGHLEVEAENQAEAERKLDEEFHRAYYGHAGGKSTPSDMNRFDFTDFDRQPIEEYD